MNVCSIEYLTTQIELMLPTFNSWTVNKIMKYLTLGDCVAYEISHSTTAYFFDPPCRFAILPQIASRLVELFCTDHSCVRSAHSQHTRHQ